MVSYKEVYANPQGAGDARPTALQIIDDLNINKELYKNKVVLITGASSGIGVETARAMATLGCTLYLPVRSQQKGADTIKDIEASCLAAGLNVSGKLHLLDLDMNSLASVRKCAEEFLSQSKTLNILINNAGIMATPFTRTADGFESQFGTNHLAHFLLTQLLLPTLLSSSSPALISRVINLTSSGHAFHEVQFDDYDFTKSGYERWNAYGQSKTANIYFSTELERRYSAQGLHSLAVHPGSISTGLQVHLKEAPPTKEDMARFGSTPETFAEIYKKRVQSTAQGAATTLYATLSPEFEHKGGYFMETCKVAVPKAEGSFTIGSEGYAPWVYDTAKATRLYEESLKMVGLA